MSATAVENCDLSVEGLLPNERSIGARIIRPVLGKLIEQIPKGRLPPPAERAIVLGTVGGASNEIVRFLHEVKRVGPNLVNPGLFPFTVMNATSGLAAIEFDCKGPNITLSSGRCSALDAIICAVELILSGRMQIAFAGGFEPMSQCEETTSVTQSGPSASAMLVAITTLSQATAMGIPPLATLVASTRKLLDDDELTDGSRFIRETYLACVADSNFRWFNETHQIVATSPKQVFLGTLRSIYKTRTDSAQCYELRSVCARSEYETRSSTIFMAVSRGERA